MTLFFSLLPNDLFSFLTYGLLFLFSLDHLLGISKFYFDRTWRRILFNYHSHYQWRLLHHIPVLGVFLLLSYLSITQFGMGPKTIITLLTIHLLILMTLIDLKYQILPNSLTFTLMILGLIANYFEFFTSFAQALYGVICGYGFLFMINYLFKVIRKKDGMGYGDFKLLAGLGALAGIYQIPLIILIASILSIIQSLFLISVTDHKFSSPSPFGPPLAIAGIISLFAGEAIYLWYFNWIQMLI